MKNGRDPKLAKEVPPATKLEGCIESEAMCDIKEVLFFIGKAILEGFITDFGGIPGKNGRDPVLEKGVLPTKGWAGRETTNSGSPRSRLPPGITLGASVLNGAQEGPSPTGPG